jgi:hypothetical protein
MHGKHAPPAFQNLILKINLKLLKKTPYNPGNNK